MDTLAFPVRFKDGHIVSHAEETDAYYNQLISLAFQISPGEMALAVDFGMRNMTFEKPTVFGIKQTLSFYFPEIFVSDVNIFSSPETEDFSIELSYTY
jgi:hypothetical protein